MNNRGMQLSINFLVTIIIMIVLLGLELTLFSKVIINVNDYSDTVTSQEQERLKLLCDTGQIVATLDSTQKYDYKNPPRFPIGITNEGHTATANFEIDPIVGECKFIRNDGTPALTINVDNYLQYPQDAFEIQNNERVYRLIVVTPDSTFTDGQYKFKIGVKRDGHYYGKNQTIWVTVD